MVVHQEHKAALPSEKIFEFTILPLSFVFNVSKAAKRMPSTSRSLRYIGYKVLLFVLY